MATLTARLQVILVKTLAVVRQRDDVIHFYSGVAVAFLLNLTDRVLPDVAVTQAVPVVVVTTLGS